MAFPDSELNSLLDKLENKFREAFEEAFHPVFQALREFEEKMLLPLQVHRRDFKRDHCMKLPVLTVN